MTAPDLHRPELQRCDDCGTWNVPALERCPTDSGHSLRLAPISGGAEVFSYVVNHVAFGPAAKGLVPYPTALVQLDEGPRLLAHLAEGYDDVTIGDRVTIHQTSSARSSLIPEGALVIEPATTMEGR